MISSIIVMDNDPPIRVLVDEILTLAGYEVHLYDYELPDRDELWRVRPALIICDYLIEDDAPGRRLWAMITQGAAPPNTRRLLCTASVEHLAQRSDWWNATGIPIITKPFDVDAFLCTVHRLLLPPCAGAPEPGSGSGPLQRGCPRYGQRRVRIRRSALDMGAGFVICYALQITYPRKNTDRG